MIGLNLYPRQFVQQAVAQLFRHAFTLGDKSHPIGSAEYKLQEALPETLENNLPRIEKSERELKGGGE